MDRTEQELMEIRNFGSKSVDEIRIKLAELGVGIRE
jgi:DNA-directed RNA polymerase subunit alpha